MISGNMRFECNVWSIEAISEPIGRTNITGRSLKNIFLNGYICFISDLFFITNQCFQHNKTFVGENLA